MEDKRKHCYCCGKIFIPNKRLGDRQKTCGRDECKKKLNRKNQLKWRQRNSGCFTGRYSNTKAWREKNPHYQKSWRKKRREIQNSIPQISPMKSIRCLVPVNFLKNEIQNSILALSPIDITTYKARVGT